MVAPLAIALEVIGKKRILREHVVVVAVVQRLV
jgi:hypothetical protein